MSLTRPQQILLKQAQAQCGLSDEEYRHAIEVVTQLPQCRSSTDSRLTDRHCDLLMGFFESIYWRGVDALSSALRPPSSGKGPFRERGYWSTKNPKGNSSRDRFAATELDVEITRLETRLQDFGKGPAYCASIARNCGGRTSRAYRAALEKSIASLQRQAGYQADRATAQRRFSQGGLTSPASLSSALRPPSSFALGTPTPFAK